MKNLLSALALTLVALTATAQSPENFQNPPNSAKPRVWWHWMNGNVTKEGIQKDLDWMERTGIGGFQNFDANLMTPPVVKEKLVFMTPKWKEAFKFTTDLAKEKGLEMAIAGSPGWSVTGGPWVKPEHGMKKYVWSEVLLKGGQTFSGKIPQPSDVAGPFQDVPMVGEAVLSDESNHQLPHFYRDAYVIAYKLPETEKHLMDAHPKISVSGGDFDVSKLLDHDIVTRFEIPPTEVGQDMYIQYAFDEPQTFKAFGVAGASEDRLAQFNGVPLNRSLKVSDDGINFREVVRMTGSYVAFNTMSIPETTAKYWRMCFTTMKPELSPIMRMMGVTEAKPQGVKVGEFVLFNTSRIDQWEDKAGFMPWTETGLESGSASDDVIAPQNIINLSSKMAEDGSLTWEVPPGEWMILRLGYSLTGRENHPASPEATGLEVDKLDENAVRTYINAYLDMYQDATGNQMGENGLGYMILDSYEAGHMNWTHDFPEEFKRRRGYDLLPWLPALTGRVVKSMEVSEKFLWDFRKTIGEMIVDNHYEVIGEELHKRGMKRYTESHENKRIYLADGMDVKKNADIPMSAMWTPGSLAGGDDEEPRSEADIREAASVANIYGKPYVAAESMTSVGKSFQEYPEKLKRTADLELASGLNRFVIHTSVHQPLDKGPGFSLGPFGQYFSRLETWSGAGAKAWIGYLGRSSYMMQQGQNVADILYLYGENTNATWVSREKLPETPEGYEWDFVSASILKEAIKADDQGELVAPSGNRYKVLMLDESTSEMTLSTLQKIGELATYGVKIIGKKPVKSPSLVDNQWYFEKLANAIWSRSNVGPNVSLDSSPDVLVNRTDHKVLFRHRKTEDADIYWLNNRNVEPTDATISFNVSNKTPKLWNAETGEIGELAYSQKDGRTEVPLHLKSWDAVFVVFDEPSAQNQVAVALPVKKSEQVIAGQWNVNFDGLSKQMTHLVSWTEDENTKHFSGTAVYSLSFKKKKINSNETYLLELEDLKNIAEVSLNGQVVSTIWKKPYQADLTGAIKKGINTLEIKVTNTWVNKLVGDAAKQGEEKETFTTMPFYAPNSPLYPAGILGKVKLITLD
ncbi:glycosyl hydrolase [Jiulongibacter sediminis]|jgi:hypothetical protein|uniref:glycosyl hydrolase n=1 Tax=Jiulongibacter sediminis TaxID=1605367 RepID=UPI0026EB679F|nr:glycosyl hydrolase [Jiulongibacter sediminis]